MSIRVLIIGSGLLGTNLYRCFYLSNIDVKITTRSKSPIKIEEKNWLRERLVSLGSPVCDNIQDYKTVIEEYKPTVIIDTIPQPSMELVTYLMSIENCFKFEFSSPASDFANKCPIGSYPRDKLELEKIVNERAKSYKDALIIQIGFIPEIATFEGKPVASGLSYDTMVMCNLLSLDNNFSNNFDITKGYTCTTTANVYRFLQDIILNKLQIPNNIFGRTLAMHSSQVWPRSEIIKTLSNINHVNQLPRFYGQKSEDQITKPVKEFLEAFAKYSVLDTDIIKGIINSATLFKNEEY